MIRDTNIKVDRDLCIACGICVDRCVLDNLRLSVAPCRQVCPLHMNCQGAIRLIAQGEDQQAIASISEFLPFIGVLGLFCHAPCENACARKQVDRPVNIRALHRYLGEQTARYVAATCRQAIHDQNGIKVAIWGSGPAAMMAAWRLSRSGHRVVVHEPEREPGGVLRVSNCKSDIIRQAVRELVDAVTASGVDLRTGIETIAFDTLFNLYDAVIIAYQSDKELKRILVNNGIDPDSLHTDSQTLQVVEQKKIFICNDLGSPKSPLINALAAGKKASESVHRFVSGVPLLWERGFWDARGNVRDYVPPLERARHVQSDENVSIGLKKKHENNTELKFYSKEEAIFEAERCLSCGRPFDANHTCWYCLPCEIECPNGALEVRIPYLLR